MFANLQIIWLSFNANVSSFSLTESPPRDLQITAYKINNCVVMRNVVQLFLAANTILLMRKWNHAFLLLAIALAWKWQIASLPEDIP